MPGPSDRRAFETPIEKIVKGSTNVRAMIIECKLLTNLSPQDQDEDLARLRGDDRDQWEDFAFDSTQIVALRTVSAENGTPCKNECGVFLRTAEACAIVRMKYKDVLSIWKSEMSKRDFLSPMIFSNEQQP